jgi:putative ABC transport system ATP-binding protein
MSPPAPLVALSEVAKSFPRPDGGTHIAVRNVSLHVARGEWVAVLGKSGCGKSTLLNLIAGLDEATAGQVQVADDRLAGMDESALAAWRGRTAGVVFQFFQLLPTLTVLENVVLAMELAGRTPRADWRERARHLLALTGIDDQADKLPATLSGGQQQRAAIARALANDPPLLLADEPTGNLDSQTAGSVLDLFATLRTRGTTLITATHDAELAGRADRIVEMHDGCIVGERKGGRP